VEGPPGARTIGWTAGLDALSYTRDDQPSDDAARANASGWNCRTHVEYEGRPAVDWYIPSGTPSTATMDGVATLYVITVTNAFDYYSVDREPYVGDPDRSRAPLSPFPGPGGGKGVFVRVENEQFVTEYAHLDAAPTIARVPDGAFLTGYGASFDHASAFGAMRGYLDATPVAKWQVRRGDVIGLSGDSGYSEAPHLHYTIARSRSDTLLCPTAEHGFDDGAWLLR
jgi:murein DD-endopeptidase MepM/ murein hydrolase activator NlpD